MTPRDNEVLDLALAAAGEIRSLLLAIQAAIYKSHAMVALAEDAIIAGDVACDPVSAEVQALVAHTRTTISKVELDTAAVPADRPRSSLN